MRLVSYASKTNTGFQGIVDFCFKPGANKGFPLRAPPAVQHGDFIICNTPAISAYLGRKFGLMPPGEEAQGHVEQILAIVTDGVSEGRLAFHPKVCTSACVCVHAHM